MSSQTEERPERSMEIGSEGAKKFGKTTSMRRRKNNNRFTKNRPQSTPRANDAEEQTSLPNHGDAPDWFVASMSEFKKQITADVTQSILRSLETSLDDDATRRRYKASFFALKNRYIALESELAQERAKNNNSGNPSNEDIPKVATNGTAFRRYGYQRPSTRPETSKDVLSFQKNGRSEETTGTSSCESDPEKLISNPITSETSVDKVESDGKAVVHAKTAVDEQTTAVDEKTAIDEKTEVDKKPVVDKKTTVDEKSPEEVEDGEKSSASEETEDLQNIQGFVSKIRETIEKIIPGSSMEALKKEILGCKELNESDIIELIGLIFEKAILIPELSDSLSSLLRKIHGSLLDKFNVQKLICSHCEKNFGHQTFNEIVFIGSLYDQKFLEVPFMQKCIQHFSKAKTETAADCLRELLDIVGSSADFWKGTECLDDLEKVIDQEGSDNRLNEMINRILRNLETDE